jgi:hypothetical protein
VVVSVTRRSRWPFAALMILSGLMLGIVIATLVLVLVERSPALHILAHADAGQVAQHDGRILIYAHIDQARYCQSETTHWLFTNIKHGDETVRAYIPISEDGPVPIRELGQTSYVLSVPLPPGLWPAEWFWLESSTEKCGPLGWLLPIYSQSEPLLILSVRAPSPACRLHPNARAKPRFARVRRSCRRRPG